MIKLIKQVKELKKEKNKETAKETLLKLEKHTYPLMKKRGWTVGTLQEMIPKNENLLGLNINRGAVIKIRLRRHDCFLPWDDVFGTMLHELAHIKRGPHDAEFYKILDELFKDYEELIDNGFNPDGNILGGKIMSRKEILEAADKRKWLNTIMPAGGTRLGGSKTAKDIKKLAAEAALKRAGDALWCGSHMNENVINISDTEIIEISD